jgi:hypothetical protein
VLTHTDPPLEDAIELFNPSGSLVNIGGWYLSNSKQNFKKFRIPDGTTIPANGYAVFYETNFNTGSTAFTFSSAHGDSAIIAQADAGGNLTGYRTQVKFGAAQNGVSFGRYQTSVGVDFTALSAHTFGADNPATVEDFRLGMGLLNAAPKVGPVVISEIMYRSLTNGVENPDEEFIELQNIIGSDVSLFDPAYPTNTWRLRDAVAFDFPENIILAAGSRLLLVGFNSSDANRLAAFRSKFGVSNSVPIFGPWNGRLDNSGDNIELYRPDIVQPPGPDEGFVPQILVDKVSYSPLAPWPTAAANGSNSLQRINAGGYGNDPVNWLAAAPTAGAAHSGGGADSDGDGMPDSWEMAYFGTLARNGTGDFDNDGQTDLEEYLAGTNPADANSNLKITSAIYNGSNFVLRFTAMMGRSYTVQYRNNLGSGTWLDLSTVPAQTSTGPVEVIDAGVAGSTTRFYHIVLDSAP